MMKIIFPAMVLSAAVAMPRSWAFLSPISTKCKRPGFNSSLPSARQSHDDVGAIAATAKSDATQRRRDFLLKTLASASLVATSTVVSFPSIARADDDYLYKRGGEDGGGDLTSQLFNPDGSLRDPNMVVNAQDKTINLPFSVPSVSDGFSINVATDGAQPANTVADSKMNLKASYNLPLKWNQDATSQLPLYYDSSEGKNGKSCNRITVYSVSAPINMDTSTLEKASRVGVAKSLFVDRFPQNYFDQGVLKADLISGRTVRKPIKSGEAEGEIDEQVYYEFDLAFAPLECPDYAEGNRENLGLGFCPYDKIFLISATVLNDGEKDKNGTLMVCVVECNKDEWKRGNSDIKRVRNSFVVDRASPDGRGGTA